MNRRFLGRHEPGAHVHPLGAQGERRHQTAGVGHSARRHEWNLQFLGRARQQDHVGQVILARVAAALEAVHTHGVTANGFGLERVAHRGALVDDLDARLLQRGHVGLGAASGCLHDAHAALGDGGDVLGVRRRGERGQERQVHAERLVCHFATAADLLGQQLRRLLGEAGDQSEASGVGNSRREFRETDVVHAALDDGVADAEKFSDACLHCLLSLTRFPCKGAGPSRRSTHHAAACAGTSSSLRCVRGSGCRPAPSARSARGIGCE